MEILKYTQPDAKFIRTILKGTGVKIHRCRLIDGKLFVTVDSSKKEFIKDMLIDLGLTHRLMRKVIYTTFEGRTSFENLVQEII